MTELNTIESLREKVVTAYNELSPIIKRKNPERMGSAFQTIRRRKCGWTG